MERWSDGAKREGQEVAAERDTDVRKGPMMEMEMEMDVDVDGGGI